ncbi:UNVERIFIED_CONTAM: hypothetical protein K2H54_001676 [Gekko kuhli]
MKSPQLRRSEEEAAAASWRRLCLHELRGAGKLLPPRHSPEPGARRALSGCGRLRRAEPRQRAHVGGGRGAAAGEEQRRRACPAGAPEEGRASFAGVLRSPARAPSAAPGGAYPLAPGPHEACRSPPPRKRLAEAEGRALQQTRRLLANARERTRVHTISAAFEALRKQEENVHN